MKNDAKLFIKITFISCLFIVLLCTQGSVFGQTFLKTDPNGINSQTVPELLKNAFSIKGGTSSPYMVMTRAGQKSLAIAYFNPKEFKYFLEAWKTDSTFRPDRNTPTTFLLIPLVTSQEKLEIHKLTLESLFAIKNDLAAENFSNLEEVLAMTLKNMRIPFQFVELTEDETKIMVVRSGDLTYNVYLDAANFFSPMFIIDMLKINETLGIALSKNKVPTLYATSSYEVEAYSTMYLGLDLIKPDANVLETTMDVAPEEGTTEPATQTMEKDVLDKKGKDAMPMRAKPMF